MYAQMYSQLLVIKHVETHHWIFYFFWDCVSIITQLVEYFLLYPWKFWDVWLSQHFFIVSLLQISCWIEIVLDFPFTKIPWKTVFLGFWTLISWSLVTHVVMSTFGQEGTWKFKNCINISHQAVELIPPKEDPDAFSSVQLLSCDRLLVIPWTARCQAFLSITSSQSLLKLMSIEPVMPSSHLILCHLLLFLPSIFPIIRVFSSESVLHIRWPKYWSFSLSISPSNE